MNERNKKILRYLTMPQILPRLEEFISSGFSHIAFFMALTFRAARLLPDGHPYLNPMNIRRFGLRHVVAEAGSRLVWKRENADQIVIFWLILTGLVILAAQFCLLGVALVSQAAHATMPDNYAEFFVTKNTTNDLAFILLDRVFGIPDIFNSCVAQKVPCPNNTQADAPYPFHAALHGILQFYSIGLLVVAVLIFLYFIMAIVAETAQTGTPFGKRFNHVWAPLRMVMALGLLVPLGSGLNSAQYITLYAAKWGSGFATNGWNLFVTTAVTADQTLLGNKERLIATPGTPPVNELVVFFSAAASCVLTQKKIHNQEIKGYLMNPDKAGSPIELKGTSFAQARDNYYGVSIGPDGNKKYQASRIIFYFGYHGTSEATSGGSGGGQLFPSRLQNTDPTCGALSLEFTDVDKDGSPGSEHILEQYYELVRGVWGVVSGEGGGSDPGMGDTIKKIAEGMTKRHLGLPPPESDPDAPLPSTDEMKQAVTKYQQHIANAIQSGASQQESSTRWVQDLQQFGWAGAAIWYNQVATINGALIGAAYNLPMVVQYPKVMEQVKTLRVRHSQSIQGRDRFNPVQPNGDVISLPDRRDQTIAKVNYESFLIWQDIATPSSGNILIDFIYGIFGLDGLFNMAKANDTSVQIHPLAQLVAIGKSIVNRAVINLGDSFVGFGAAAVARGLDMNLIGSAASALASFQGTVAILGLGIGFVLFYVVPFLPFMYFFFAVGAWIKTIFEAMVGVPLWALAHIRIDGNGLPGDAAMGGYYLILDIFLRPILIIFGMLAGITIFAAQVRVLHEIWELVVSNVAGFSKSGSASVSSGLTGAIEWLRSPVDSFFYTIIYAIIVYMLGLSSFKLVDIIPNNILRWMGSSAHPFADSSGEEAGNVMRNAMMSSTFVAGNLKSAGQGMGAIADAGSSVMKRATGS